MENLKFIFQIYKKILLLLTLLIIFILLLMICFPNAKINLGLNIISKRNDGFHNIETLMYPIPLFDVLEFKEANEFSIDIYGENHNINTEENTLKKTWEKLNKIYSIPSFNIKLLKNIPCMSGLGGGSSDASFFLKEINSVYKLEMSVKEMENLILEIGSDCPFFIMNYPSISYGKGEKLKPININLSEKFISIVKPKWGVSTKEAFNNCKPKKPDLLIENIVNKPLSFWKENLNNDFENTLNEKYPIITEIKDFLYDAGANYSSISGSGSAIYAISDFELNIKNYYKEAFIWQGKL